MNLILDIVRGLAAMSVFFFHVQDVLNPSLPGLARVSRFGSLGVAAFFVISGYVIIGSAEAAIRKNETATAFLKRRFMRIYPPFWLSLIVVLFMPYLVSLISALKSGQYSPPNPRYFSLTGTDWLELISLTKVFRSPDGDLQSQFNQVNSVYWTLAIEFQFYLCVFAALGFRRFFRPALIGVTAISLAALIPSLGKHLNPGLFIHFWPMFAVGSLLYYVINRGYGPEAVFRGNIWLPSMLAASILIAVLWLSHQGSLGRVLTAGFGNPQLGFSVVTGVLLWLASSLRERFTSEGVGAWPRPARAMTAAFAHLGRISYSVYLLHAVTWILPDMFASQVLARTNAVLPIVSILATLLICDLFHRIAERPFMSRRA